MADAGVAEVQHDGAAADGQVLVAVPLGRGGLGREQLAALPVGHDDVLGLAAARVLRRQQLAHGAVEAEHDVEPAEDPAVEMSEKGREPSRKTVCRSGYATGGTV